MGGRTTSVIGGAVGIRDSRWIRRSTGAGGGDGEPSARIALLTEGSYPYAPGGLSVWCHQLVGALPDHRFSVHALTAVGDERPVWPRLPNVDRVQRTALWGPAPGGRRRAGRRASARWSAELLPVYGRLLGALEAGAPPRAMLRALRALRPFVCDGSFGPALLTPAVLELQLHHMRAHPARPHREDVPPPALADAVTTLTLLEHLLRPLAAPTPRADLCHCVADGLSVLIALGAKWDLGTPMVVSEHGLYLREHYLAHRPGTVPHHVRAFVLRFFRQLAAVTYQAADVLVPSSHYNRRWELAVGAPVAKIVVIRNGVDPLAFPPASVEPAVPTISWLGRIDPLKDLETLLRAFAIVRRRVPGARLRVFGTAPTGNEAYLARCRGLAHRLRLEPALTFEGHVDDPVHAYHAGHVVALSSISEGFPYAVLEAMAAGRPVVATDVGGVSEALGDTGAVVPPADPLSFARACTALLTDPARRAADGAAGRRRVLGAFTVDRCASGYRTVYGSLTSSTGSAA